MENCTPSCSPESKPATVPDDSFAARNVHGCSNEDCVTEWERPFLGSRDNPFCEPRPYASNCCHSRREIKRHYSSYWRLDTTWVKSKRFLKGNIDLPKGIECSDRKNVGKVRTFMNPGVSGGAVGIMGAVGVAGPGAGPYSWASVNAGKRRKRGVLKSIFTMTG